jgi:hypothetical protein
MHKPMAKSATQSLRTSGVLVTITPCFFAAHGVTAVDYSRKQTKISVLKSRSSKKLTRIQVNGIHPDSIACNKLEVGQR